MNKLEIYSLLQNSPIHKWYLAVIGSITNLVAGPKCNKILKKLTYYLVLVKSEPRIFSCFRAVFRVWFSTLSI